MDRFVRVGSLDEFPDGRGRAVDVCGERVAVFRTGERLDAMQDKCPHMGASLADGRIRNGRVACHMHGWTFDVLSGEGDQKGRPWCRTRIYKAELRDGDVWVERPPDPEPDAPDDGDSDPWVPWDDSFLKPRA